MAIMHRKIEIIFLVLFLVLIAESRRHPKKQKVQHVIRINSTIPAGASALANPRNRNRLWSPWSQWSRCGRRCKQVRSRHCRIPAECGTAIIREDRSCFKDRCVEDNDQVKDFDFLDDILTHQDESSAASEFKILYHFPSLYSEWTTWSPCNKNCYTHRTKTCKMPDVCGDKIVHENALCYVENSACARLYSYSRKRKGKKSSTDRGQNGIKINPLDSLKCGVSPQIPEVRNLLRIIGGREAEKGSWPWQVTILSKFREPFCGGTLLHEGWILTAAHCIRKRMVVRAGEHNLMSSEGTEQESRLDGVFIHPDYDEKTVNNDIALLKLKHPFTFNKHVQPVCLPSLTDGLHIGTRAVIIGWGKRTNTALYGSDELHQAEVPIVDLKECRDNYDRYQISNRMICAGFKQGRVDSCSGDSGGPLLYQKDGKWIIFGITSFGEGCGERGKFGIYANVPKFVKWIRKTIERHS